MDPQTRAKVAEIGRLRLESQMSRLEGEIRVYLKFISMIETINRRVSNLRESLKNKIEVSENSLLRINDLIKTNESNISQLDKDLLLQTDTLIGLKAANSADKEFIQKLDEIEEEADVKMDLTADADVLKAIKTIADIM